MTLGSRRTAGGGLLRPRTRRGSQLPVGQSAALHEHRPACQSFRAASLVPARPSVSGRIRTNLQELSRLADFFSKTARGS